MYNRERQVHSLTSLIRHLPDYGVDSKYEKKKFQVNQPGGGGRSELIVAYANGDSIEFMIRECFERLDDVQTALTENGNAWTTARRFTELKHVLRGEAREHYDNLVGLHYAAAVQKRTRTTLACAFALSRLSRTTCGRGRR